jgi:hypothetical protein
MTYIQIILQNHGSILKPMYIDDIKHILIRIIISIKWE